MKKQLNNKANKSLFTLWFGLICASLFLVTAFAWFTGSFSQNGIEMHTGQIDVAANVYCYQDGELKKFNDVATQGDTALVATIENTSDDLFIIVEKTTNSINLDYQINFTLEQGPTYERNDTLLSAETQYIDSFWFKICNLNSNVNDSSIPEPATPYPSTLSNTEIALSKYVDYASSHGGITNTSDTKRLSDLNAYYTVGNLSTNDADYYAFTYGLNAGITLLGNRKISFRIDIQYSQEGALTPEQRSSSTITCPTLNSFSNAIREYVPGQTIIVTGSYTYNSGDIIFTSPVNLKIVNCTLTIQGNLMWDYAYADTSYINTASNGYLKVVKNGRSGGNLEINTPLGQFEMLGKGASSGSADISVQGNVIVRTDYDDDDSTLDNSFKGGLYITKSNIFKLDTSGNAYSPQQYQTIYFRDNTKIEVGSNTRVGSLIPYTNAAEGATSPYYVKVINYGTIDYVNFGSMNYYNYYNVKPQIYFHNHYFVGTADDNYTIFLPYWSRPFYYDESTNLYTGNTYIYREFESNVFNAYCAAEEGYTNQFTNDDIQSAEIDTYITESLINEHIHLDVFYADHNDIAFTLQSLFEEKYYVEGVSAADNLSNLNQFLKTVYSMKITCNSANFISSTDTAFIRTKFNNLVDLDLCNGHFVNYTVPTDAFRGMSHLENLDLPYDTNSLGHYMIYGTAIHVLTLPESVTTVGANNVSPFVTGRYGNSALSYGEQILFVRITNSVSRMTLNNYTMGDENIVYLAPEHMLSTYRANMKGGERFYHCVVKDGIIAENYSCVYEPNGSFYSLILYTGNQTNTDMHIDSMMINDTQTISFSKLDDYCFQRVTYNTLTNRRRSAFSTLSFGDSVKEIGTKCFYYCDFTSYVDFNKVEILHDCAFYQCSFGSVINANNITTIGNSAFSGTSGYTTFNADNCLSIGDYGFYNCDSITSFSLAKVKSIGTYGISCSDNIVNLSMPCLEITKGRAFYACTKLETIYAPKLLIYGHRLFAASPKLTEITLGFPYYGCEDDALFADGCNSLRYVFVEGSIQYLDDNATTIAANCITNKDRTMYYGLCGARLGHNVIINKDFYDRVYSTYCTWKKDYYSGKVITVNCAISEVKHEGTHYLGDDFAYNVGDFIYEELPNNKAKILGFPFWKIDTDTFTFSSTADNGRLTVVEVSNCFDLMTITCETFKIPDTVEKIGDMRSTNEFYRTTTYYHIDNFIADGLKNIPVDFLYGGSFVDISLRGIETISSSALNGYLFQTNNPTQNHRLIAENVYLDSLTSITGGRVFYFCDITNLYANALETLGGSDSFISSSSSIDNLYFQNLKTINKPCFSDSVLGDINLPSLETSKATCFNSCTIGKLTVPSFKTNGGVFLYNCTTTYGGILEFPELLTSTCRVFGSIYGWDEVKFPKLVTTDGLGTYTTAKLIYCPVLTRYSNPNTGSIEQKITEGENIEVIYLPKLSEVRSNTFYWSVSKMTSLHDIYIGYGLDTSQAFYMGSVPPSLKNIYVCGSSTSGYGDATSWQYYSQYQRQNVNVYCKTSISSSVSSAYKASSLNYSIVKTGDYDPADLFYYKSGIINENGQDRKYGQYHYFIDSTDSSKVILACCNIPSITLNTYHLGGNVTIQNLKNNSNENKTITKVLDYLFQRTTMSVDSVTIDSSVTEIGNSCFASTVNYPKAIGSISVNITGKILSKAFSGISNITQITIGEQVSEIEANAFDSVSAANVYVLNYNAKIPSTGIFPVSNLNNLIIPAQLSTEYLISEGWNNIPLSRISTSDPYVTVGDINYFYKLLSSSTLKITYSNGSNTNTTVVIPNSFVIGGLTYDVVEVESAVLRGIGAVETVQLPDGLVQFNYARNNEPSTLSAYVINSSNTHYKTVDGVLYNGDGTLVISYPKNKTDTSYTLTGVTIIPSYAFANNNFIQSITLSNAASIYPYAFKECESLVRLIFNGDVSIASYAFDACPIETIVASSDALFGTHSFSNIDTLLSISVTGDAAVYSKAFEGCYHLGTVTISGDGQLESDSFNGCKLLTSITVGGSCNIGSYAFKDCVALATASFGASSPSNAVNVGLHAFDNCKVLTNVTIGGTSTVNSYAFNDCVSLTNVTFAGFATINSYAFANTKEYITLTFTSSTPALFDGYYTFGTLFFYTIDVPDANLSAYQANVLFDSEVAKHMA